MVDFPAWAARFQRMALGSAQNWHEELTHQFDLMDRFETERRILSVIPFAIASLWLPVWLCLALVIPYLWVEFLAFGLLRRAARRQDRRSHRLSLLGYFLSSVLFLTIPALTWQAVDGYAKAFSLGVLMVNLNHIATIRAVHLPLVWANIVPATLIGFLANTWFWYGLRDWRGMTVSSFSLVALTYFVVMTILAMHDLHRSLAQGRRAAEEANEAKSRFLAQMSHELRTPLNAIMGLGIAELAQTKDADSRARLGTVVQSAQGLSVLLDDILDLSAVEAGALPIRPLPVAPQAVIDSTLALFAKQIADSGQDLKVSYDLLPSLVMLDGQRLRQCLSNVLSNAVKYGGPGVLELQASLAAPDLLVIEVTDSGPGVPPALREQIFEPFRRGEGPKPGTGLGLAITRRIARRMGGDLELRPSARGARFRLTLAAPPAPVSGFETPRAAALADLSGKRVLVVDDIATNRLVAVTYLRMMGATALQSANAAEALDLLLREPVDVVLLDMVMPGMDGLDLLQSIRALRAGHATPSVIALTADATEERRQACLAAGLDGYVVKPVLPEMLGEALIAALNRQNAPASSAEAEGQRAPD